MLSTWIADGLLLFASASMGDRKAAMNSTTRWLKVVIVFAWLLAGNGGLAPGLSASTDQPRGASCAAPEYRQFDFWVGDWDAFEIDSSAKVARTRIDLMLDGCVLHEDYEGVDGHKGQSFSIYDASRKVWHQSWVTNRGELLTIEGTLTNGEMVLRGMNRVAGGAERRIRGTWKPVTRGVRETAVISMDAGKTWKPWFDLVFRPHKP